MTGYETVFITNDGGECRTRRMDASGFGAEQVHLPGYASVAAGESIEVRLTAGPDDPASGVYYTGGGRGSATCPRTTPRSTGDVAYLMDNAGPYETGNLRTWFPYPCNPDDCMDPLLGKVAVLPPDAADWNTGQDLPSAPRQVDVTAAADNTGDISIAWQAPTYIGDSVGITGYRISGTEVGGPALSTNTVGAAPPLTYTWTGLTAGKAYSFAVEAQNAQGWSSPSASSSPVTSRQGPREARLTPRAQRGIGRSPPGGPLRPPRTGQL